MFEETEQPEVLCLSEGVAGVAVARRIERRANATMTSCTPNQRKDARQEVKDCLNLGCCASLVLTGFLPATKM
jgi:hypothetical protein